MPKRSLYIIASLLVIYMSGFSVGLMLSKDSFQKVHDQFEFQVKQLEADIRQIDFINRKLKESLQILRKKNEYISEQSSIISQKQLQISKLTQRIAEVSDPALKQKLQKELIAKTKELNELRRKYELEKIEEEKARQNLEAVNTLLKQKNEKILQLRQQLKQKQNNKDKAEDIERQIQEVKDQITHYENGSIEEHSGDNYKGWKRRKRKDQHYAKAIHHYWIAGAEYDLQRVYNKIRSNRLQKKLKKKYKLSF